MHELLTLYICVRENERWKGARKAAGANQKDDRVALIPRGINEDGRRQCFGFGKADARYLERPGRSALTQVHPA